MSTIEALLVINGVGLLINLPLIPRVIAFMRPLKVSEDGSRFCGRYRHWKLSHVTGSVQASTSVSKVYDDVRYDALSDSTSHYLTRSVHDTVRLQTSDGHQHDVRLHDYRVSVQHGDVISVWYAWKRSKWTTVAVLNHTTRQQTLHAGDLFSILEPHGLLFIAPSILLTSLYVVFGGFLFVPLWVTVYGLYLWGQKRIRRGFATSGVSALWTLSSGEAQRLGA